MTIYVSWVVSAMIIAFFAIRLGQVYRNSPFGILIDARGRYSLTHFQLVLWSIVVLSLIAAVVAGKLLAGVPDALGFEIPTQLLATMGISIGSTAAATAVKSAKDAQTPERIAASNNGDKPRLSQMLLVEEGEFADKVIDVTKFQNLWFTIILVGAYTGLAAVAVGHDGASLAKLPDFNSTIVTLLGISHAGYVAGKMPARPGSPSGLTLAGLQAGAVPVTTQAATASVAPTYVPRNP